MNIEERGAAMRRGFGVVAGLGCTALYAAACSVERQLPEGETVTHTSERVTAASANKIPCAGRNVAVTANTGKVTSNPASLVNSYDSALGAYGGSNIHSGGGARAATIIDALGGVIKGSLIEHSPGALASVAVPVGAKNLPLGSGTPGNININGTSDSITLSPGNYVVNNITVNFPGQLKILPAGQVNVFVKGTLNLGGTENSNGLPNHLTFFVSSSNTVNVNANGKLFGSIYAPNATVNVNSQIYGSVVGAGVTLNSGGQVHYDEQLVCPSPLAATPPPPHAVSLPLPPRQKGCFMATPNGWVERTCTTNADIRTDLPFPDPQPGIATTNPTTIPLQFGGLDVNFGTVRGLVNGSTMLSDTFSIQANSNTFPSPNQPGKTGWVQFTIGKLRSRDHSENTSSVCIWNWDMTAFAATVQCLGANAMPTSTNTIQNENRALRPFDFGSVGLSTYDDGSGHRLLGLVAQMSWFDPANDPMNERGLYAVVGDDLYGLGLGAWKSVTGGVLGYGGGATATFTDATVLTRILAGTCVNATGPAPAIPWPGLCPTQPPLLGNAMFTTEDVTAEGNNLLVMGNYPIYGLTPDLVFTQFVASDRSTCLAAGNHVYVKDHPDDTGAVPSNPAGQPFWQSPDVFVVPNHAVVDKNSIPSETLLTPGQNYDAYVRVNNDFSCGTATGVSAHVYLADPSALTTNWTDISIGYGNPGNKTIGAGDHELIGPFTFQAPPSSAGGHKCLLAAVKGPNDPQVANEFDAPSSPLVAQRNIQLSDCAFPLPNVTAEAANLALTLSADGADPSATGIDIGVEFDDPVHAWYDAWLAGQAAGGYTVTNVPAGKVTVRLGRRMVNLATVSLPGATTVNATGHAFLDFDSPRTTLNLGAVLTSTGGTQLVSNGGSCVIDAPSGD